MHYLNFLWRVKRVLARVHGGLSPKNFRAEMLLSGPPLGYTSGVIVDLKDELENNSRNEGLNSDRSKVDLRNGFAILSANMKSNRIGACSDISSTMKDLEKYETTVSKELIEKYTNGFDKATTTHKSIALKRERAITALSIFGQQAIFEDPIPIIIGNFNASYTTGKKGNNLTSDCKLEKFACEKVLFPKSACNDGNGFNDLFTILENSLITSDNSKHKKWTFPSNVRLRTLR
jgi:hypothetical protein